MKKRRGRETAEQVAVDVESLSELERLLVCQAVYERGQSQWEDVADILARHDLIPVHHKHLFTPQTCPDIFYQLVRLSGLHLTPHDQAPRSAGLGMLAHGHYSKRLSELRDQILEEEAKFKQVVQEIDDIRAGKWDHRIMKELGFRPPTPEPQEEEEPPPDVDAEYVPPLDTDTVAPPEPLPVEEDTSIAVQNAEKTPQEAAPPEPVQGPEPIQTITPLLDYASSPMEEEQPAAQMDMEAEEATVEDAVAPDADDEETTAPLGTSTVPSPEPVPEEPQPSEPIQGTSDTEVGVECSVDVTPPAHSPPASGIQAHTPQSQGVAESKDEEMLDESAPSQPELEAHPNTEMEEVAKPESQTDVEVEAGADAEAEIEDEVKGTETPEEASEVSTEEVKLPPSRSEGKRKVSDTDLPDNHRDRKRAREESEPVEEEETSISTGRSRRKSQAPSDGPVISKKFQAVISMLHNGISAHRYGNIFHNPIKKSEAPDYHDIVKRPMDLKTIKARVRDGVITNSLEYQRDVFLMFANAMMYNRPGSEIYNMAEEMMLAAEKDINAFKLTETFHRESK
ncbi:hypothetical protein BXZ70DRAFT_1004151 [Cristinia sonorae]|uniref:Bromo domain-containing protein n=1 Tax=Cristinia sonorae TaxID=1940300 RepID=A0A8K0UX28_9AGAR|nr:hypothetical protein BXZ70DRAFT_1004151 [Cristinia sonorae]